MRVFKDRRVALDFDWNHTHKTYVKGIVHVHEWYVNKNGKWARRKNPRYMTEAEIQKYGEIILKANPNIKLRP